MSEVIMDAALITGSSGEVRSRKHEVSAEEWALREDLAALYRLADMFGWSDLIFTHFSARVPGEEAHFLINPYGWLFEEVTASSLVKVDVNGNKVDDAPHPVNPAGFAIHAGIHMACEDAHCIMHLHTPDGTGVSAQEEGLLPISQQGMIVCEDLAYYEYGGPGHHLDEGTLMAQAIGNKHFAILRNHGTLTVGRTCADALIRMHFLEQACSFQVRAQAGRGLWQPNQGVPKVLADMSLPALDGPLGQLSWAALRRKLDRIDPSYRD